MSYDLQHMKMLMETVEKLESLICLSVFHIYQEQ